MRGSRERRHALAQRRHLGPASCASSQVAADRRVVLFVQGAEDVLGETLPDALTRRHGAPSAIDSRSLSRAVRIRVFAVPTGIPSSSATSVLVLPPK